MTTYSAIERVSLVLCSSPDITNHIWPHHTVHEGEGLINLLKSVTGSNSPQYILLYTLSQLSILLY